jgi:hypothetical protein
LSGFGALCPLPLRLGADGWSSSEFLRLTADAGAVVRAAPFARVRVSAAGSVLAYSGAPGTVPSASVVGSDLVITWPARYVDSLGSSRTVALSCASFTADRARDGFADSDMDLTVTSEWTAGAGTTLTKQSGARTGGSGARILFVGAALAGSATAAQNCTAVGVGYTITGWAKGDGVACAPVVLKGDGSAVWTGTTSTAWQQFSATFTQVGSGNVYLAKTNDPSAGWAHFDDVDLKRTSPIAASVTSSTSVTVYGGALSSGVCVTVYGSDRDSVSVADYGGASDKRDSVTESTPYAWSVYQALQDARGSSYSREHSGLVHVENLALARSGAARWRDSERLACNSNPETATELLRDWARVLGIARRTSDTPETLRAQCGARFRLFQGPREQSVNDACSSLLGSMFVRVHRLYSGDLSAPPTETYWPGVNAGPAGYDLGGGTWLSERSRITVEVSQPSGVDLSLFQDRVDRLSETLDRALPAWATYDWSVNTEGGFVLDFDQLDYCGLGR